MSVRWRTLVLFIALGGLLAPVVRAPGATAQTFRSFTLSGERCVGSSSSFVLPLSRAQERVPKPFTVYDYAGIGYARGTIRVTKCAHVRVDGSPPAPAVFSSVLIDVNPPSAGGESSHMYELWRVDSSGDVRQRFANVGMTGDVVEKTTLDQPSPAPLTVVQGSVPWPRATVSLAHAAPDPTNGLPLLLKESAWHKGPFGTFRTFTSSVEAQHAGPAAMQLAGELSALVGLPGAVLPGFVRFFSFTARVEAHPITTNPIAPR